MCAANARCGPADSPEATPIPMFVTGVTKEKLLAAARNRGI